jgi:hypothetical protein
MCEGGSSVFGGKIQGVSHIHRNHHIHCRILLFAGDTYSFFYIHQVVQFTTFLRVALLHKV